MTPHVRQAMAWVHTWFGLVSGWLLFVMFVTGACGYYRHELTLWMTPEVQGMAVNPVTDATATRVAQAWLQDRAPSAEQWTIVLPDARSPLLRVAVRAGGGASVETILDPRTGAPPEPPPRQTRGGDFLYRLHFDLYFISPILARFVVGFCAVVLLATLATGLVVHGRLLAEPFRFRPGAGRRTWLDTHNLAGLLALPFHVAVAYSGLVCLMILLLPWGVLSAYGAAGLGAFAQESFPQPAPSAAAPGPAPTAPLARMVEAAGARWRGARVGEITVRYPNDRRARVEMTRAIRGVLSFRKPAIVFDGVTGRVTATVNEDLSAVARLHSGIFGFHVAHFAGGIARLVLFLLGLVGAVMIATGLVLWSMKRMAVHGEHTTATTARWRLRLVDALNAGTICGLTLAIAGYLWANRLVPVSAGDRAAAEIAVFFWIWAGAFVAALSVTAPWRWSILLGAGGAALLLTPLLGVVAGGGVPDFRSRPAVVTGVDLVLLTAATALLSAAWLARRGRSRRNGVRA